MYKSLYPSEDLQHNISTTTQIGMVKIDHQVHDKEDPFGRTAKENEKWTRGGAFLEDFQSGNILEFCARWLHFGRFKEVIDDMIEYIMNKNLMTDDYYRGKIRPIVMTTIGDGIRNIVGKITGDNKSRPMVGIIKDKLTKEMYHQNVSESSSIRKAVHSDDDENDEEDEV